jgi:dihydroxyacetone kinase
MFRGTDPVEEAGLKVTRLPIGRYVTSLEMPGASITVSRQLSTLPNTQLRVNSR